MKSIKSILHSYAAKLEKTWQHDRLSTVGASEIGQCLRKTWFSKNEAPQDAGYVDRFGAKLRGDIIESHYWVPGILASLPEGWQLLYAGREQRTLVDGYLSATPDGLLISPDGDCTYLECKSIDPRANLPAEKPEHSFQTQAGMGLVRHATEYQPDRALISYIDASFLDEVTEFAVAFDPAVYQAAKDRARLVMTAEDPLALPPEGKLSGGDECKWCPWASHCAAVAVAGIPASDAPALGHNAITELKALRDKERELATRKKTDESDHAAACEAIKEFLRANGVRGHKGDGWSVSWSAVKGRTTLDTSAVEAAGLDLTPYQKPGKPGDHLNVT